MFFRNTKIINKKYQLRMLFKLLGLVLTAFIVLVGSVTIVATMNYKEMKQSLVKMNGSVADMKGVIETENNIVMAFIEYSKSQGGNDVSLINDKVKKDHDSSMILITKSIRYVENYLHQMNEAAKKSIQLLTIVFGIILVFIIMLIYSILKISHRVAGPMYVMSKHMDDLLEGKDVSFRDLRKGDEFQEFYEKFKLLAELVKKEEAQSE